MREIVLIQPEYNFSEISDIAKSFITLHKKSVIIITGPTGSGKTELAQKIESLQSSMLINADSRQIFIQVNIGSNKPVIVDHAIYDGHYTSITNEEKKYWLMDCENLKSTYSAQDFREQVRSMITKLHNQNIVPILVGGSIHWIKSAISSSITPYYVSDENLYAEICSKTLQELQLLYRQHYPDYEINESDWANPRRLGRAIEFKLITGHSIYDSTKFIEDNNDYLIFQTTIDKVDHRKKIKNGVINRLNNGWIEEVENIIKVYNYEILDKLGLGYKIIGEYIKNGKIDDVDKLIELITIAEMHYAKKQIF